MSERMDESRQLVVAASQDPAMLALRQQGAQAVALRDEKARYAKMIEGGEWGSGSSVVRGSAMSPAARTMLAEFCLVARANPYYHVDLLGGKPFLNEKYWSDRINSDPQFVDWTAINISADPDARQQWAVPAWAEVAFVVTIRKLANFAPLDRIRSGEIREWSSYVVTVQEANWAGGRPPGKRRDGGTYDSDPIGNAEPSKSARTRALRRCAAKAFPVWCAGEDERLKRIEDVMVADFTIVKSEALAARALLPGDDGQAVRATGEPSAVNTAGAQDLPEWGSAPQASPATESATALDPGDTFDHGLALRGFFATWGDAGFAKADTAARAKWARENGLPESTKEWGPAEFEKALAILTAPARAEFQRGCEALGHDEDAFAHRVLGARPATLRDFKQLNDALRREADGGSAELPL